MGRLAGKIALVTGASRGLGREIAVTLAGEGAVVAAVGRDGVALDETVAATDGGAIPILADVRIGAAVEEAVAVTVERLGGLDLLVNAAGVLRRGKLEDLAESDWDLLFETNVKSCFLTLKYAVPAMRRRGGGAVVNISSVYAHAATADVAAYAASKGAVAALTRAAALDHIGDGIRINCIAPGTMPTPMVVESARQRSPGDPDRLLAETGRLHPIGRLLEPAEIARLVLFLLSDDASGIVGSCYTIDGGRLALLGSATNT